MDTRPILIVEDNPDDQALALRAFRKIKLTNELVVANDGVEALDYLFGRGKFAGGEQPVMPSIVLLDLKLPKVDGFDVLKEIRANERTRLLPVIIVTSSKEQDDLVQGYQNGANSYVRKPVDFNQFVDALSKLGVYWLLLNEPVHNG